MGPDRLEWCLFSIYKGSVTVASFRYAKELSKDLRYGNKAQRAALLKWVNLAKFKNRKPTPEELTKECLRKGSLLFGLMKTSQKRAAEVYWRQTAQDIIRHINVVKVNIKTEKIITEPVRLWVPIGREQYGRIPEDSYIPRDRFIGKKLKRTILKDAHRDLMAWIQRYEREVGFADVFSPVLKAYTEVRQRFDDNEGLELVG